MESSQFLLDHERQYAQNILITSNIDFIVFGILKWQQAGVTESGSAPAYGWWGLQNQQKCLTRLPSFTFALRASHDQTWTLQPFEKHVKGSKIRCFEHTTTNEAAKQHGSLYRSHLAIISWASAILQQLASLLSRPSLINLRTLNLRSIFLISVFARKRNAGEKYIRSIREACATWVR